MLSIANKPIGNYIEIINNLIPDGVIKIRADSKPISERIRVLCWKINEKSWRNFQNCQFWLVMLTACLIRTGQKKSGKKAVELNESMEN